MSSVMEVLPDDADLQLSETDRRELVEWTIACAERMLPLFLAERPDDERPREALDAAMETSLTDGLAVEKREFAALFDTADQKEGMAAFREKRPPHFQHR